MYFRASTAAVVWQIKSFFTALAIWQTHDRIFHLHTRENGAPAVVIAIFLSFYLVVTSGDGGRGGNQQINVWNSIRLQAKQLPILRYSLSLSSWDVIWKQVFDSSPQRDSLLLPFWVFLLLFFKSPLSIKCHVSWTVKQIFTCCLTRLLSVVSRDTYL